MKKIAFLIAGYKGYNFLKIIHKECKVACVVSYATEGTLDNSYDFIRKLCRKEKYNFFEKRDLDMGCLKADLIFIVGWQYLLDKIDDRIIVFHDSLLPKFRGFAPTVNALILGNNRIGVTALKPHTQRDAGPICAQTALTVKYPLRIKDAYDQLAFCYVQIARDILRKSQLGKLKYYKQNNNFASYSLWRDKFDYLIDWSWPAKKIARFVDALSWPYLGAKTMYEQEEIVVDKVIAVKNNMPEVICGEGIVRILSAMSADGKKLIFTKLRKRFG
jgi:methionyl-tRNA formyltransferase